MNLAPITKDIITDGDAAGVSAIEDVSDYSDVQLQVAATTAGTAGTDTFTIRVYGSYSKEAPDFSAAATKDNEYFGVATKDLSDDSTDANSVGIVVDGDANFVQGYLVNVDRLRWVCVKIEDAGGTFSTNVRLFASESD